MILRVQVLVVLTTCSQSVRGFSPTVVFPQQQRCDNNGVRLWAADDDTMDSSAASSRRTFLGSTLALAGGIATSAMPHNNDNALLGGVQPANAIGPVKVDIINPKIVQAIPCPPEKPIPGEKAMQGMRPICVTIQADFKEPVPKTLEKVGVYGFVTAEDGESVLANNPDGGTDAGQFTLIESVKEGETKAEFEFIAAIVADKDLRQFENGVGPLQFSSLRIISFPGGQQYGAINPCEMNEFSDECEAWEEENGPYKKVDYMIKSNARTKGR